MNVKLLAAAGLAVALLGYFTFKPKADKPAKDKEATPSPAKPLEEAATPIKTPSPIPETIPTPAAAALTTEEAEETDESSSPTSEDVAREESLSTDLQADKELNKVANITLVGCLDGKCTIDLEAKGDENVQMKMFMFMNEHHEKYGRYSRFDESKENPRVTRFILSKEKL